MSLRFLEMKTAKAWGLTPSEWWAASRQDQGYMMALVGVEARMAAWEAQEAEKRRGGEGERGRGGA